MDVMTQVDAWQHLALVNLPAFTSVHLSQFLVRFCCVRFLFDCRQGGIVLLNC